MSDSRSRSAALVGVPKREAGLLLPTRTTRLGGGDKRGVVRFVLRGAGDPGKAAIFSADEWPRIGGCAVSNAVDGAKLELERETRRGRLTNKGKHETRYERNTHPTIMLVGDYGSDSDSEQETPVPQPSPSTKRPLSSQLPAPAKKSTFSLPPPTKAAPSSSKSTGGLALPPPKPKKTKKITIDLPALPQDDEEREEGSQPPAKKPRLEPAGSSTLFGMLPAPKQKAPVMLAQERVLGGGKGPGLVFNTSRSRPAAPPVVEQGEGNAAEDEAGDEEPAETTPAPKAASSLPFLPPSLAKGRSNISLEETSRVSSTSTKPAVPLRSSAPAVDFFSLEESVKKSGSAIASSSKRITVSSAPQVKEFVPPEPTQSDPYPGYYMLPSGSWAAYDPEFYKKFYDKWKVDYDRQVRAMEKGRMKGFEGAEDEGTQEVNTMHVMEKAKVEIQEREEKKALTQGEGSGPAAPKMNIKGAKLGRGARTRHQLTTLLTEAYENREALEERIAQGRRNRKEAGNKYGF
ncbi:hypothetical protein EWM64_g6841 [Hericium alpestre]|uniref:Mitotic checkpoint regulator, MAD2B-interacting-domain-containing protein n=1 Tax=Hericium alpestre TaxID=135208 RepID=A0A4Y9ZUI0_9AGAM|nr:hypothetical protein EWM64_g6841 [Hericium alpestre]